jgi:hypothetical protein
MPDSPAPDARPFAELRAVADEYAGKARRWEADLDRPGVAGRLPYDEDFRHDLLLTLHNCHRLLAHLPDVLARLDAAEARAARMEAERDALMFLCDKVGRFLDRQGYDRRYCEDHGLRIRGDIDAEIASVRLVVAALAPASPAPEAPDASPARRPASPARRARAGGGRAV